MTAQKEFWFDNVWQNKSDTTKEAIISFWLAENALPNREAAEKRLDQVAVIARASGNDAVAAVSTLYRQFNQRLGHPFYYFRCFVGKDHRRKLLAAKLLVQDYEMLNARFQAGQDPKAVGMLIEVENQGLNEQHRKAVWDHSGFTFIGYNQRSQQLRLRYFDGARI